MTWPTGAKPPLHRRFDEARSLELIRNRYSNLRTRIPSQVANLQADTEFTELCKSYYGRGYRDWLIVSAIFNSMLNWVADKHKWNPDLPIAPQKLAEIGHNMSDISFPTWRFEKDRMDIMINMHNASSLTSYGFQPRRSDFRPEIVERFLRERMRHFELDIPHHPLFGVPSGEWPEI